MEILDSNENFLAIEKEYSSIENSRIVIVPVPYEFRVSYGKGAKHGPEAILNASAYVEFFDDEFDRELCFDMGIATLKEIEFGKLYDKAALKLIEERITELLDLDKFIVSLGGEHTISTAAIRAHYLKYPEMSLLHFDAHSDLRDSYEDSIYSHACFMSRVIEFYPPDKITQVGIRALCKEEREIIREKNIKTFFASAIRKGKHGSNWQSRVVDTLGKEIYITFDVDYFDPSIMPSTGTPEPDGFLYNETLDLFREIMNEGKRIVGFDVVELAPAKGLNHPNLTTARLIYKLLNFAFNTKEF